MIKSSSFSRLEVYKECPLHAKFKFVDKIKELPRELIAGKTEHANDRGSRVHAAADDFINGRCDSLIQELHSFKEDFANVKLIKTATPNLIETEQLWTCDSDWNPTNAEFDKQPYLRVIIDLLIFTNSERTHARVIDFKTGKMYGNEVKHASQLQLYIVAAFTRYPQLQEIDAELWYVDKATKPKITPFTRDQGLRFKKYWTKRIDTMHSDETFTPRPHERSCMFCPYGPKEHSNQWVNKSGECEHGVDKRTRSNSF